MPLENDAMLRIGRLEDKMLLYEPLFASLQGIVSIPAEIDKIHVELGALRESRIETREKLTTLFKAQTRTHVDLAATEKTVDYFKLKGWDLLFWILPWIIAISASMWAMIRD